MRSAFKKRRDFLVPKLNEIPGVTCHLPKGAFYVFPRILEHLSKKSPDGTVMNSDIELAAYLLETCGVATVPGTAFGAPGYLRMSYGASIDDLQEGISRISKGLQALSS
jgi:aspartate/methionine/tyrosine aminotransferase